MPCGIFSLQKLLIGIGSHVLLQFRIFGNKGLSVVIQCPVYFSGVLPAWPSGRFPTLPLKRVLREIDQTPKASITRIMIQRILEPSVRDFPVVIHYRSKTFAHTVAGSGIWNLVRDRFR